jgi:Fe-S-cluster containining protein
MAEMPSTDAPAGRRGGRLAGAVAAAQAREPMMAELLELLEAASGEMAAADLTCLGGGGCCRFDLAGHRLYASTAELALLSTSPAAAPARFSLRRCGYQSGPRCAAHRLRPLGCRCYFCRDSSKTGETVYEKYHDKILRLHELYEVTYFYVEILELRTLPANRPERGGV